MERIKMTEYSVAMKYTLELKVRFQAQSFAEDLSIKNNRLVSVASICVVFCGCSNRLPVMICRRTSAAVILQTKKKKVPNINFLKFYQKVTKKQGKEIDDFIYLFRFKANARCPPVPCDDITTMKFCGDYADNFGGGDKKDTGSNNRTVVITMSEDGYDDNDI
ncbi:hypothetical protein X798_05303 [Onchocerca flexuosa]|uniref:Uncharacterized protein n=1 Tax=Onchocerca flexuosa TaxID=387005 RepID=A0A238BQL5_9BILA|nr:hypothetical protein X798_05303 [Onchocerca flexuosa]